MPIYVYRCSKCAEVWERYFRTVTSVPVSCPECGSNSERAYDLQTMVIRQDIEPGYNMSLGEYVGSRKELREKLAYHNANSELMLNGNPSAGRLTNQERDIVEGLPPRDEVRSFVDSGIEVEGEADYSEAKESIKQQHVRR